MKADLRTPTYSFWPLFLAIGILLIAVGIVWTVGISVLGLLLMFASIVGWTWENRTEEEENNDE